MIYVPWFAPVIKIIISAEAITARNPNKNL